MEVKQSVKFEHEINDQKFIFEVPIGAPLGDVYNAAGAFIDKVIAMINEHKELREKQNEEPAEENKRPPKPEAQQ